MGCDIHLALERRADTRWRPVTSAELALRAARHKQKLEWSKNSAENRRAFAALLRMLDREDGDRLAPWFDASDWDGEYPARSMWVAMSRALRFNIGRHYALFALMANVRNYALDAPNRIVPISEPRGLPEGVSKRIREMLGVDGDNHSQSWLLAGELAPFLGRFTDLSENRLRDDCFADLLETVLREFGPDDARFVFAFDN